MQTAYLMDLDRPSIYRTHHIVLGRSLLLGACLLALLLLGVGNGVVLA